MTKDELITKQQLEIESYKQIIADHIETFNSIYKQLTCIGGPLNDNVLGYTKQQITRDLKPIAKICESYLTEED